LRAVDRGRVAARRSADRPDARRRARGARELRGDDRDRARCSGSRRRAGPAGGVRGRSRVSLAPRVRDTPGPRRDARARTWNARIMKLAGEYKFDAAVADVWEALFDPAVLAAVLPGCEKLELVDGAYVGELKIKIGPVQGNFIGKVGLADIVKPQSYTMDVD